MTTGRRHIAARQVTRTTARGASALAASAVLGLAACASPSDPDPAADRTTADASAATEMARSLNEAGFLVFQAALADGENTAVSPLSIGLAFGMLDAGASGSVAESLDAFFAYPASGEDRLAAFNSLDLLASNDPDAYPEPVDDAPEHAIVRVANRVFIDTAFTPADAYRDDVATYFGAGVQEEPLASDSEESAKNINAWVEDRTEGLIPDLVSPDVFNDASRLALVNALYMKASWATPFDTNATYDEAFTLRDGDSVDVPMMHSGTASGEVFEGDDFVAVSLPYAYDELEMTLIVPEDGAFDAVQDDLDQQWLDDFDAAAAPRPYGLTLPSFTTTTSVDLRVALEAAGAKGIFNVVGLDGIGPELEVTAAVHATKVIVDEAGTEAAAATAIVIGLTSAQADPPLEIRADSPFLYVIRDVETGAVLFVGRVLDPR